MNVKSKTAFLIIVTVATIAAIVFGGVMCFRLSNKESVMSAPKYVAHRGFSEYYPDNTAASFTAATENEKFYGIETDIRRTKDGILVCSHDDKAVFIDESEKKIEESTYAELIEKPLKNTKTKDKAYICLFSDYLKICKKGNKIAVVELKDVFTEDMIAQTLSEINSNYDRKMCTVIAFDYDSLYRMRVAYPAMDLQYLSSTKNDVHFKECLEKGISVDIHIHLVTPAFVKKFHDKGLVVNVWTVNDKKTQERMRRSKVDFITSNVLFED